MGGAWLAVAQNRRSAWETVSEGLVQSISERMLHMRLDAYDGCGNSGYPGIGNCRNQGHRKPLTDRVEYLFGVRRYTVLPLRD